MRIFQKFSIFATPSLPPPKKKYIQKQNKIFRTTTIKIFPSLFLKKNWRGQVTFDLVIFLGINV